MIFSDAELKNKSPDPFPAARRYGAPSVCCAASRKAPTGDSGWPISQVISAFPCRPPTASCAALMREGNGSVLRRAAEATVVVVVATVSSSRSCRWQCGEAKGASSRTWLRPVLRTTAEELAAARFSPRARARNALASSAPRPVANRSRSSPPMSASGAPRHGRGEHRALAQELAERARAITKRHRSRLCARHNLTVDDIDARWSRPAANSVATATIPAISIEGVAGLGIVIRGPVDAEHRGREHSHPGPCSQMPPTGRRSPRA